MPNIHFLGFKKEAYQKEKEKIDAVLKKIGLSKDAITTFHPGTIAESCDGKKTSMPYLYIFSSENGQPAKIINAFCKNGLAFDIEDSDGNFILADKMAEKHLTFSKKQREN